MFKMEACLELVAGPIQFIAHPKSNDKSGIDNAISTQSHASESKQFDTFNNASGLIYTSLHKLVNSLKRTLMTKRMIVTLPQRFELYQIPNIVVSFLLHEKVLSF